MLEITKEYAEFLLKLEDSGYEVSYQLLQTSQHLNFYNLTGKIQIKSKFYSFQG
jgi:ATP adenylyltransferase/5',5'''-P-1,P-4-tetraphosphate phosphorylase II